MYLSIRTRLMIYILPTILVISLTLGIMGYHILSRRLEDLSQEQLRHMADNHAGQLNTDIQSYRAMVSTMTSFLDHYKGKNREEISAFLKSLLEQHPKLLGTFVAYEPNAFDNKDRFYLKDPLSYYGRFSVYWNRIKGPVTVKAAFTPLEPGQPEWEWYTLPRDADSMIIMEPYFDEGVMMTSCISPIHQDGRFIGVAGVDILLKDLHREIQNIPVFDNGHAFLISRNGLFMSFRDSAYLGEKTITDYGNARQHKIYQTLLDSIRLKKKNFISFYDPVIGSDAVMVYTPIPAAQWTLVLVASRSDILETANTLLEITGIMGFVLLVLFILIIYIYSGRFVRPIWQISSTMDTADINTKILLHREDEIGFLAASFNKFIESVRRTVMALKQATNTLSASAKEISASTDQIAVEAKNQTAQTSNAAASVEEINRATHHNAQNAVATKDMSIETQLAAEDALHVIDQAVGGMNKIAGSIKKSHQMMQELNLSSAQIGRIVHFITEITKQTNLIALNASVEAVRAGDKGKGFAVVASEIQKLADRTGRSTLEINELITKIQNDINETSHLMETSRSETEQGIVAADRARNALQQIVDLSQNLSKMIAQIAATSQEQINATDQLALNIKNVDAATQQIAGSILQIARAADDLEELTRRLQILVGYFKLSDITES